MKANDENNFESGFLLVVDDLLESRDVNAATPAEALATLLRSRYGYLVLPGTKVRVFRVVEQGENTVTKLYRKRVELDPLISTEKVLRRIYNSSLNVTIDFVFDVVPGESLPGYEDLLREVQSLCPRIRDIQLRRVVLTDDIHICDEECAFFGTSDHDGVASLDVDG